MVDTGKVDHMSLAFKALGIYAAIVIFSYVNYYVVRTNFEYP